MNILLIYPEFPDTFWGFTPALKFIDKKASLPPLGLMTVAAMLPSEWKAALSDLNVGTLTEKDLAWADVAFSAYRRGAMCIDAAGDCAV